MIAYLSAIAERKRASGEKVLAAIVDSAWREHIGRDIELESLDEFKRDPYGQSQFGSGVDNCQIVSWMWAIVKEKHTH